MSMTDPIADLLTHLRNAIRAGHEKAELPASREREAVVSLLTQEGYLAGYRAVEEGGRRKLVVRLRYDSEGEPVINGILRVSKPGRRVYRGATEIQPVLGGLGTAVVSTSRGLLTDRGAREQKLGGEVLFNIW